MLEVLVTLDGLVDLLGVGGEELLVAVLPLSVRAGEVPGDASFMTACTGAGTIDVSLGMMPASMQDLRGALWHE